MHARAQTSVCDPDTTDLRVARITLTAEAIIGRTNVTRRSRLTTIVALALAGVAALLGPGSGAVANAAVSGQGVPPSYVTFTMDCGGGPMLVAAIGSGRWDAYLVVGTTQIFAPFADDLTVVTPGGTFTESAAKGPLPPGVITCTRDNWFGPVHVFGTQTGLLN